MIQLLEQFNNKYRFQRKSVK